MYNIGEKITVNSKAYTINKLLGKGKGGYSFLVTLNSNYFVLKKIHHEPCDYYQFGNKIESEYQDYHRLKAAKILMPKLLDIDFENEIIIKEYIEGEVVADLIKKDVSIDEYIPQIKSMAILAKNAGLNIDYYPTNFVIKNKLLYYIDYECNEYKEEWNLDNWGIKYWLKLVNL